MKKIAGRCLMAMVGSIILAFGLYNVHSQSLITEGGTLGLTLLLQFLFGISPAVSGAVLNFICFAIGIKVLGKHFLLYSAVATLSFSVFYRVFEQFNPIFTRLAEYPLEAAVLGAVFVGIGVGISVKAGGASGGDDAFAMAVSHKFGVGIQWVYLISDVTVLLLSVCYIPVSRLIYSLLTVFLSGQIIAFVQKIGKTIKK